jgi:hypothetical protein
MVTDSITALDTTTLDTTMAMDSTMAMDTTTAMDITVAMEITMALDSTMVIVGETVLPPGIRITHLDPEPIMAEDALQNTVPLAVIHQATVKQLMVEKQLDGPPPFDKI